MMLTAITVAVRAALPQIRKPISRDVVFELERAMEKLPQLHIEVVHHFSEGVYAREMTMPKGTLLTGKIHKFTQLNILSAGEVSVLIGTAMRRVKAPFSMVAPAGAKRIIYAHEESVWTVVHGTHETDLEKIEAHFIAQDEGQFQAFLENKEKAT